jgi:V/A-type H+-transporting ATPase subunit D
MAKLNIAPTRSNLLALKRQLAFAQEGYDLLEQKRQTLILELMSRLNQARQVELKVFDAFKRAFAALREAELDIGSRALDEAALAVTMDHDLTLSDQHLIGIKLPRVSLSTEPLSVQFGLLGTSANTDLAMRCFVELLPLLAELAAVQSAVWWLAREVRKTQRRCNVLSKIFIPDYRETIDFIISALEERERESLIVLKMIRNRLAQARDNQSVVSFVPKACKILRVDHAEHSVEIA